ncbi:MAG: hypothetical protein IKN64_07600 [Desulfovibrio sp.]|nr:hypothetical protein [Desulfovibrio sp.]
MREDHVLFWHASTEGQKTAQAFQLDMPDHKARARFLPSASLQLGTLRNTRSTKIQELAQLPENAVTPITVFQNVGIRGEGMAARRVVTSPFTISIETFQSTKNGLTLSLCIYYFIALENILKIILLFIHKSLLDTINCYSIIKNISKLLYDKITTYNKAISIKLSKKCIIKTILNTILSEIANLLSILLLVILIPFFLKFLSLIFSFKIVRRLLIAFLIAFTIFIF